MRDATLLLGPGSARSSACTVVIIATGLALFGFVVLLSVSPASPNFTDPYANARTQATYIVGAVVAALVAGWVDYRLLRRHANVILGLIWILLIAVLVMPGAREILGARRWLPMPLIGRFQPSEVAKLGLLIWCSAFAERRGDRIRQIFAGALPCLLVVGVTCGLVLAEKDIGTTVFLGLLGGISLMVNGLRLAHVLPALAIGAPALLVLMSDRLAHARDRLSSFAGGFEDPTSQVAQALVALGSGGLFGRGFGDSRAHLTRVSMIHNDLIVAAVGEQLGFVGTAALVAAFVLLFLHGLRIAARASDTFGFTLAFGISFMIALQAGVNIAVASGMVPPKGINLPFVSHGGSSLLLLGAAVGLLVSVARHSVESLPATAPTTDLDADSDAVAALAQAAGLAAPGAA